MKPEEATLRYERRFAHDPQKVWAALTEPDQVRVWSRATHVMIDPRLGGRVDIRALVDVTGRITVFDPPRTLEHEFIVAAGGPVKAAENAVLRWDLAPDGDGTRLTMTFTRVSAATARIFVRGQPVYFDLLEAYLGGRR
jgi:uncharacterized protein YndB with AHSA1/START domain